MAFLGGTSCDYLQVNHSNATIFLFEETSIGVFCEDEDSYTADSDQLWQVARMSMIAGLAVGFASLSLSWTLATVCPAHDIRTGTWHLRGWRILGVLSLITCAANLLSFLMFDSKPCNADSGNDCEIRLGSFLVICSCVLYVSTAVITECTNPPVLIEDDKKEPDDPRNVTIDTIIVDSMERGQQRNGYHALGSDVGSYSSMNMNEITDDQKNHDQRGKRSPYLGEVSPRSAYSNSSRAKIHPYPLSPPSPASGARANLTHPSAISPRALQMFDEEDPAERLRENLEKVGRIWKQHPDEILVPTLQPESVNSISSPSRISMLSHRRKNPDRYAKLVDEVDEEDAESIYDVSHSPKQVSPILKMRSSDGISQNNRRTELNQPLLEANLTNNNLRAPTGGVSLSKTYKSGESEEYLLHLLNEKRILDDSMMASQTSSRPMDEETQVSSKPSRLNGRRRRGRSTTPRSRRGCGSDSVMLQTRDSGKIYTSAPSTPTGMYTYDSHMHRQVVPNLNFAASNISRITFDNTMDSNDGEARSIFDAKDRQQSQDEMDMRTFLLRRQQVQYQNRYNKNQNMKNDPWNEWSVKQKNQNNFTTLSPSVKNMVGKPDAYEDRSPLSPKHPPPSLPIILSSSTCAREYDHSQQLPLTLSKDPRKKRISGSSAPSFDEQVKSSFSASQSHTTRTALLDTSASLSDDNTSDIIGDNGEKLGLSLDKVYDSGSQSPSILYLGERERITAMEKLQTPSSLVYDIKRQRSHSFSGETRTGELPVHRAHAVPQPTSRKINVSSTEEGDESRSSSVPPVMRMRKLRQKIIKSRFDVAPISHQKSARILSPRDQVSLNVREESSKAKFDWEERHRGNQDELISPVRNTRQSVSTDFHTKARTRSAYVTP